MVFRGNGLSNDPPPPPPHTYTHSNYEAVNVVLGLKEHVGETREWHLTWSLSIRDHHLVSFLDWPFLKSWIGAHLRRFKFVLNTANGLYHCRARWVSLSECFLYAKHYAEPFMDVLLKPRDNPVKNKLVLLPLWFIELRLWKLRSWSSLLACHTTASPFSCEHVRKPAGCSTGED